MEIIAALNIIILFLILALILLSLIYFKTIPLEKLKRKVRNDEILFATSSGQSYKIGDKYNKHTITRIEKGFYYHIVYGKLN